MTTDAVQFRIFNFKHYRTKQELCRAVAEFIASLGDRRIWVAGTAMIDTFDGPAEGDFVVWYSTN